MKLLVSLVVGLSLVGCYGTVDRRTRPGGFSLMLPARLPPMVVLDDGVSVVSDLDDEVFFSDGYYYARQDRYWYRTRDHRSGWAEIGPQVVPGRIRGSPPGQYRRYHAPQSQQGDQYRDIRRR